MFELTDGREGTEGVAIDTAGSVSVGMSSSITSSSTSISTSSTSTLSSCNHDDRFSKPTNQIVPVACHISVAGEVLQPIVRDE